MSKTFKKLHGNKRYYVGDVVVQERDLYRRSDRRSSSRKSEKDNVYEWTDMNMKRRVRRNDGWQKQIPSAAELNNLDNE